MSTIAGGGPACTGIAITLALAIPAGSASAQSIPQRHWLPIVITASAGGGTSSVPDQESHFLPLTTIGIGVRVHDFGGLLYERRQAPGFGPDKFEMALITLETYPLYRKGFRPLRISGGYGSSKMLATPFVGGHSSETVAGSPRAVAVAVAVEKRIGIVSIAPYWTFMRTLGRGLTTHHCDQPYDSQGHSTLTCSDGPARPMTAGIVGISAGIR